MPAQPRLQSGLQIRALDHYVTQCAAWQDDGEPVKLHPCLAMYIIHENVEVIVRNDPKTARALLAMGEPARVIPVLTGIWRETNESRSTDHTGGCKS